MSVGSTFKFVNLSGICAPAEVPAKRRIAGKLHLRKPRYVISSSLVDDDSKASPLADARELACAFAAQFSAECAPASWAIDVVRRERAASRAAPPSLRWHNRTTHRCTERCWLWVRKPR